MPPGKTDQDYVLALLRATGVLVVYGSGFGTAPEDGYFRVVFLALARGPVGHLRRDRRLHARLPEVAARVGSSPLSPPSPRAPPGVPRRWYLLVTLVMTWPLPPALARDIPWDLGDSLLNCWILGWNSERLLDALRGDFASLARIYDANIFYPQKLTLAYSELLLTQTLQALPVYVATGNLILAYNLVFLATFVLSGVGAFLLVRQLTGDWRAGFAAGLVYAFLPWRFGQMPHMQVLSAQWMPFTLYGFARYFDTRNTKALAWAGVALVANNLSNGYFLLFFAPVVPAYALWEMARRGWLRDLRTWISAGDHGSGRRRAHRSLHAALRVAAAGHGRTPLDRRGASGSPLTCTPTHGRVQPVAVRAVAADVPARRGRPVPRVHAPAAFRDRAGVGPAAHVASQRGRPARSFPNR